MARSVLNPIAIIKTKFFLLADVLLIAYISTMVKQDLQSLVMAISCSQVQRRPMMVERIQRNTLGQQQSYRIAVPWRCKQIQGMQKLKNETQHILQERLQTPKTFPDILYIRPHRRAISVKSYFSMKIYITEVISSVIYESITISANRMLLIHVTAPISKDQIKSSVSTDSINQTSYIWNWWDYTCN